MKIKPLLLKYITFYEILQQAIEKDENRIQRFKDLIFQNKILDKGYEFYILELTQDERKWQSRLCFSLSEVKALRSIYTHNRHYHKWWDKRLESEREANIITLGFDEIMADEELFKSFLNRVALVVPYDKDDIASMPDDYELEILWNFEHHFEPEYLYYDGTQFMISTHQDAKIPFIFNFGNSYRTVINSEGHYGVIHNTSKPFEDEIVFEMVLQAEYYYINVVDDGLAEVQKEKCHVDGDDYKHYICEIVDLDTKKVLASNALCNSLDFDHFITVDDENMLRYHQVDTKKREISKTTRPYLQICNPIHYAPKAVQDKDSLLWGYIDKHCDEIIAPKYSDWNTFSDDFAVVQLEGKDAVIDIEGNLVIDAQYDKIKQHDNDLFFVRKGDNWAVFRRDEIYIDFVDPVEKLTNQFIEKHLPRYALLEDVPDLIEEYKSFEYDDKVNYVLNSLLRDKKEDLKKQRYSLPLSEYVLLFDTFNSQKDIDEAGLWNKEVNVKECEIIQRYLEDLKMPSKGYIGWEYPVSASTFDMSVEMPVVFEKIDGDSVSLGIPLEVLDLI